MRPLNRLRPLVRREWERAISSTLSRSVGGESGATIADSRTLGVHKALERCLAENDWRTTRDLWTEFTINENVSLDAATLDLVCRIALAAKDVRGAFSVFAGGRRRLGRIAPVLSTYHRLVSGLLEDRNDVDRIQASIHLLEELKAGGNLAPETLRLMIQVRF